MHNCKSSEFSLFIVNIFILLWFLRHWHTFSEYQCLHKFIIRLTVVNDTAERGIKRFQDFPHLCQMRI